MEAVSLICKLFGALVLAVDAAPYFRWGDAGQHVEVWSSSWTDASCYETACLIQSCVDELAIRGTGPGRTLRKNRDDDVEMDDGNKGA